MGRAIVRNPQVFLFDEPLSNLDAKLRVAMRAEIKELHQRLKTTTVYVTHDQVEAMTMADKIVVMHDGVVEQFGEPLELYDRPNNLFVAGFIGSPAMNILTGGLATDDGRMVFRSEGGLAFPIDRIQVNVDDRPVVLGIRPEHTVITPGGVAAEVAVVEPTGSETQVGFKNGRHDFVCLFRERIVARPGETMRIAPMPGCVHLFDAETGQRLLDDGNAALSIV
jgi:multiple sugar transport system ATP-binding protein